MGGSVMVMVPPPGRIVCVVKVTVVVAVVACSAFWSPDASSSRGDWTMPSNAPEFTDGLLIESAADFTITDALPVVAAPVATWLNVHTLAVVSHAVMMDARTNVVVPANVTPAVSPVPPVQTTVGEEVRKKLAGKLMVIGSAPAADSTLAR